VFDWTLPRLPTPCNQPPVSVAYHAAQAVTPDASFDTRWAAWIARGRAHERRVRRRFVTWAFVLAMGAAIVYAFLS
jgi:hypothetical protein